MNPTDWITALAAVIAIVISAFSIRYTRQQIKDVKIQLQQTGAHSRASLSIQQNWALFDRHKDLPPAHPSWVGLTDAGWAWRVLHLNHLNLLLLAYQDYIKGLLDEGDFEAWKQKSRFWFQNLRSGNQDPEICEGREVLRQLLLPEEGYSKKFCKWLVNEGIISAEMIAEK
jgi:hypothetical protein